MPKYEVIYRDGPGGDVHRQIVEGHAESLVRRDLESQGGRLLSIKRLGASGWRGRLGELLTKGANVSLRFGVSTGELALLCEVFKALYASGMDMLRILRITIDETPNPWLKKRLIIVLDRLREGDDISSAMSDPRCRKAFPPLMRETIRTGQENGRLDQSLERLAEIYKRASETKRETFSALLYPAFAFLVFMVVCTVIAIIIPNTLEDIIGPRDMALVRPRLPATIRILFFLRDNPLYLILPPSIIVGIGVMWRIGKKFHATDVALTRVERKLPLIGPILYQFALVRLLDLLAANNETGIQVAESLQLIRRSVGDALIKDSLVRIREKILSAGSGLGEAMNADKELAVYPGLVRQMVRAGEESGQLTEMLLPIVSFYSERARATLKRTLDMLTPIMIVLLGSVIGPVVIGVYKTLMLMNQLAAGGVEGLM
jgi:type II secretory pathway component PulF